MSDIEYYRRKYTQALREKSELRATTRRLENEAEALAASRLELAKVVNRHRKDRMHSDMKLGWEMAKEILARAEEGKDG